MENAYTAVSDLENVPSPLPLEGHRIGHPGAIARHRGSDFRETDIIYNNEHIISYTTHVLEYSNDLFAAQLYKQTDGK